MAKMLNVLISLIVLGTSLGFLFFSIGIIYSVIAYNTMPVYSTH